MTCLNITILFRNKHIADLLWNVSLHIHSLIPCLDLLMVNSIGFIIEVRNEFHDKIKIHGSGNEAMDDTECYNFINVGIALFIKFLRVADGLLLIFIGSSVGKNNSTQHIEISMKMKHAHLRHVIVRKSIPTLGQRIHMPILRGIRICKFSFLEFFDIFFNIFCSLITNILFNVCICKNSIERDQRFIFMRSTVDCIILCHRFLIHFFINFDSVFLIKLTNGFRNLIIFLSFSCHDNNLLIIFVKIKAIGNLILWPCQLYLFWMLCF